MEIKQETKSLPRNRKCGNCRYFEPAPLWRKGWCRNPRLYDRRANHLVDAATIDCEQVFRARIYWEPVPISDVAEVNTGPGYSPFVNGSGDGAESIPAQADGGRVRAGTAPADGVLRARTMVNNPQTGGDNLPVIVRRERSTAAPGIVAKPSRTRRWLVENIPYYDKIDGPLARINFLRILPWAVVALLVLIVLLNVLGGKKTATDQNQSNQSQPTSASAVVFGNTTPTISAINRPTQAGNQLATPTLSAIVPTFTAVPVPTATPKAAEVTAKVKNVGPKGLNMRKDPGTNGTLIRTIPEGETVTITSGDFKTVDSILWVAISYKGANGWVSGEYLDRKP